MSSVVILGATGTIGRCLAGMLVANGQSVLLAGRDESKLGELAASLNQPYAVADFSNSASLLDALQQKEEQAGGFCGLVNCIGSLWLKPIQATSDEDFRQVIETNLFTAFSAVRAAAKLLRENGGSVVLVASAAAEIGLHNHESIAAAKAGVIGLTRSAAASLASYNIRVNCVSPGMTRTEMTRKIWENAASEKASQEMHALGRIGEPEHVASIMSFLLNPANDWITGQVIGIDGGLSSIQPRRKMTV
jgi:3-oxoacyl-[acyl-carrier protein] reductase